MARPRDLPDFTSPPLTEVVLGVQFDPLPFYTQAEAKAIWKLFSSDYPKVEEREAKPFHREIFNEMHRQDSSIPSVAGNRWCLTADDKNSLIQFQFDCLIVNWGADLGKEPYPYPHYEAVAEVFEGNLKKLNTYYKKELGCPLKIKQAEISYFNSIEIDDFDSVDDWIRFLDFNDAECDALDVRWLQDYKNENAKPFARLHHHLFTGYIKNGPQKGIGLSFVYRGQPYGEDISSAMQFLAEGRTIIVKKFTDITTENAHKKWGRKK